MLLGMLSLGLPLDLPTHVAVQLLCLALMLPHLPCCCELPVSPGCSLAGSSWPSLLRRHDAAVAGACMQRHARSDCTFAHSSCAGPKPAAPRCLLCCCSC